MEVPGVARNYTAHLFSMQAKCYLGDVAETQGRTTMPQQPLCGVRGVGWQKVLLKFLSPRRNAYRCSHRCTPQYARIVEWQRPLVPSRCCRLGPPEIWHRETADGYPPRSAPRGTPRWAM